MELKKKKKKKTEHNNTDTRHTSNLVQNKYQIPIEQISCGLGFFSRAAWAGARQWIEFVSHMNVIHNKCVHTNVSYGDARVTVGAGPALKA